MGPKTVLSLLVILALSDSRPRHCHRFAKKLDKCISYTEQLEEMLRLNSTFCQGHISKSKLDRMDSQVSPNTNQSLKVKQQDGTFFKGQLGNTEDNAELMQAVDPVMEDAHEPRYRLLLNEANTDNPGPDDNIFIELKAIRREVEGSQDDSDVTGFILLLVKGEPLSIVMSIDIGAALHRVKGEYIVIGPKRSFPDVDIDIFSPDVSSVYTDTAQMFIAFDEVPHGFLLLHSKLESVRAELSLEPVNGVYRPIPLVDDERRQHLIRYNLVDLITLGRKTPYSYCQFFESLKPRSLVDPERKALLRDWEGSNSLPWSEDFTTDMSLSRCCTDDLPNDQECWRLSKPSRHAENNCEQRRPFYLEKIITKIATGDADSAIPESKGQCHAGYPGVSASFYGMVNDHAYSKAVTEELNRQMRCSTTSETSVATENNDDEEAMEVEETDEPLMVPRHLFHEQNFEVCKIHLTKVSEINVPGIKSWLDVIYENRKCKFRCYNCHLYLSRGFRPDIKNPPPFVSTGYLSSMPTRNKAHILEHNTPKNAEIYRLHQDATTFVSALQQAQTSADVKAAEKAAHDNQKDLYKPTMNAMKLAYAELRTEVSFRSHEIFAETVKELGVDIGGFHATDHSLRLFANAFSEGFHERLLNHLTEHQPPFSFIVDATTSRNTGFLVCLMQTIENGYPVLHLWRLIALTKSESGENMMQDISKWIDVDDQNVNGFKEFFKTKMVSFISDRGSSMVGKRKGLIAFMQQYTGRQILSVACSAHKTETAIKHALDIATGEAMPSKKPPKWFAQIGDLNNKVYTYYMSRGSKRFASLVEVGKELGASTSRIKYHHTIRWSASKKAAAETLLKNLDIVREDLRRSSRSSDKDTREKATNVLDIVTDKHFNSALAELTDMLSISEVMLNAFQLKHGLLLGIADTIRSGLKKFEERKVTLGNQLKSFLKRTSCAGVCDEKTCTLEQYDNCDSIEYRPVLQLSKDAEAEELDEDSEEESEVSDEVNDESDLEPAGTITLLKKNNLPSVPLSTWRSTLYERIIQEVKTLFNLKDLEAFDVLHPKHFLFDCNNPTGQPKCQLLSLCYKPFDPIDDGDVAEDIEAKLRRICSFYKITQCDTIISNYKPLLSAIVVSEKYQFLNNDERGPAGFWAYALNDPVLPWQADIRSLIQLILVTGQSSASAERAFSALTRLRSGDRSNLMPPMLDVLIRIALNGPKKIDEDSLYQYTLTFLKTHKRVDQSMKETRATEGTPKFTGRVYYNSRIYSSA